MSRVRAVPFVAGAALFGLLLLLAAPALLAGPRRSRELPIQSRAPVRRAPRRSPARTATALAGLASLVGILALSPLAASASIPESRPPDYDIPGGHFFTQTGNGRGGYGVRDLAGVKFWSEYQRLGGPDALGYPISKPFWGPGGFLYQGFERGLLQWRPEWETAVLANSIEIIEAHDKNLDKWLFESYHIPYPRQPRKASFDEEATERLTWLTNEQIRAAYLTNPVTGEEWDLAEAANYYGLPQSEPRRLGPFIIQRFQRIPLQLWVEDVPGMPPAGTVVGVLAGYLVRESGAMPRDATIPEPFAPTRAELEELGYMGF